MKQKLLVLLFFIIATNAFSQNNLETFINNFNYESRKDMKVSSEEIIQLLIEDKAILLDIRFEEEQKSWVMPYAMLMPLPEITSDYVLLDKSKIIVTACPHNDRAIIAMVFLKSKGFTTGYLSDGLLGLADYLRGDKAKLFIEKLD